MNIFITSGPGPTPRPQNQKEKKHIRKLAKVHEGHAQLFPKLSDTPY